MNSFKIFLTLIQDISFKWDTLSDILIQIVYISKNFTYIFKEDFLKLLYFNFGKYLSTLKFELEYSQNVLKF